MKVNWLATVLLSVIALTGCRSVHPSRFEGDRGPVGAVIASQSDPRSPSRSPRLTAARNPEVCLASFQVEESSAELSLIQDSPSDIRPAEMPSAENPHRSAPDSMASISSQPANDANAIQTLTLNELEQIAIANNPALAAANATLAKSAGLYHQVGVRPNPTLGYSGNQLADQQTDQHVIFLEQELVRGNKLALNRAVLRQTNAAQQFEVETQQYRVLTDIKIRFYEALAAQQQLVATIEFASLAQQGVTVAEALHKGGEGTLIDVLQSRTLLSEINLAIERSTAAYQGAWNDLMAIAGTPDNPPAQLVGSFEIPASHQDWKLAYSEIMSRSPELAAANAIVCEKRAMINRQAVQSIPNVTAQLGAGYDRATDNGLINFQIGAPIPFRNNNCGNLSAANADYHRALANVKRIEMGIRSRLARVAQEFESASASVDKYEQEIIPQVKESLTLSEKGYTAGELAFLQVLTVRQNYFSSNIRFIEAQGKLAQASATVDGLLLTGGLGTPVDYTDGDGLRGQSFGGQ
jgi:cobalt-zinc-cadmium efflux system outer membrane protein